MSVKPLTGVKFREFDQNGAPLAGGKLFTYMAGTTTPLATYTDASGSVTNSNPVVLDATGRAAVWLQPGLLYKFVLTDALDATQYTEDNFPAAPNVSSSTSAAAVEPGGRLSLLYTDPVPSADLIDYGAIYYVPHKSDLLPLYDGTNWALWSIYPYLVQPTTDSTKSPAAAVPNRNYDLFVWNDNGIVRLSRGPVWNSDTTRGAGVGTTELIRVSGRLVNKNAIVNGPSAQLGLYVGTIRTTSTATVSDCLAQRFVWNQYNRVRRAMQVLETTAFWDYSTPTWRQVRASSTNELGYVCGQAEDDVESYATGLTFTSTPNSLFQVGIGVDSLIAPSGLHGTYQFGTVASVIRPSSAQYRGIPGLGYHFLAWLEWANTAGTMSWYGTSNGQTGITGSIFA